MQEEGGGVGRERGKRGWYSIAEQPVPAPHLAHSKGYAALRIVLVAVFRVSRSCEHFPDVFDLHLHLLQRSREAPHHSVERRSALILRSIPTTCPSPSLTVMRSGVHTNGLTTLSAEVLLYSFDYEGFGTPKFWWYRGHICKTSSPKLDYVDAS